ncbi:hypothetical protein TWF506_004370 [Arthrobotrys conoides]|uniref:Uncharacterized protein n=1 Tax=Arthrobotrys conoides TaxID=74498 RepID=A0AAN8RTH6_9PEZI
MTASSSPVPEEGREAQPIGPASPTIELSHRMASTSLSSPSSEPGETLTQEQEPPGASVPMRSSTLNPEAPEFYPTLSYPAVPELSSEAVHVPHSFPPPFQPGLQLPPPQFGGRVPPMAMQSMQMQPMGMPLMGMQPMGMPSMGMSPMGMPPMGMPPPPFLYQNMPGQQPMNWQNPVRPPYPGPHQQAGGFALQPPLTYINPWPTSQYHPPAPPPVLPGRHDHHWPPLPQAPQAPQVPQVPQISTALPVPPTSMPQQQPAASESVDRRDVDPLPAPTTDLPPQMTAPDADGYIQELQSPQSPAGDHLVSELHISPPLAPTVVTPPPRLTPKPAGERSTQVDVSKSPDATNPDSFQVVMDAVLE